MDVQNDFMPGGVIGVARGHEIVPIINELSQSGLFNTQVCTQDNHCSFQIWPKHCVSGTPGAEFHPDLNIRHVDLVVKKGEDKDIEQLSGFAVPELKSFLQARQIRETYIAGLATDHCVKATALDSQASGFKTFVIIDACRPVDREAGKKAIEEMEAAGIGVVMAVELLEMANVSSC